MKVAWQFLKEKILNGEKIVLSIEPAFRTHLFYVWFIEGETESLKFRVNFNIKNKIPKRSVSLKKKINLIKLITKNLKSEYHLIEKNTEFAEVCVPWIAVKGYYLIFNSLLILKHLITCNEDSFKSSHKVLMEDFKGYLKDDRISVNNKFFGAFIPCKNIPSWRLPPYENIRSSHKVNKETRFKQVIKKLFDYKLEDLKREKKIKNFKSKKGKILKKEFIQNSDINLCEFFYWYRIKSNYRDLEFLDKNLSDLDYLSFYRSCFVAVCNFCRALRNLINEIAKKRLGIEIL